MKIFSDILKVIGLASTIFGVYFFFVFTISEKIPLPLDIDGLSSLLITIGLLGFCFSLIFSVYIFSASILARSANEVQIYNYFYTTSNIIKNKYVSSIVGYLIYFVLTPVSFWSGYFFDFGLSLWAVWGVSIPLLYSFYILTPNQSLLKCKIFSVIFSREYFISLVGYIYIVAFSNLSFFVYIKLMILYGMVATDPEFYVASLIFVVLSYMSLIPMRPSDEYEKISKKYNSTNGWISFYKKTPIIVCLIAMLFFLYPPVASKVTGRLLYLLGIGGGVERVYYYTPDARIRIPNEINDKCEENKYCITKSLKVKLGVGGVLYVYINDGNYNKLIGLPSKNMFPIISLEKDTKL